MNHLLALLALLLAAFAAIAAPDETALKMGVLAYRPKPLALAHWRPVASYLEKTLKRHVELTVYDHAELTDAVAQRAVDIVVTTPNHFILLQHVAGVSAPLATLLTHESKYELSGYGGVIVTRAERADIRELDDLAGKRIAVVSTDAFGGFQMQAAELVEAGLPVPPRERLLVTGQPHDRAIEALLDGRADSAFVRAGVIEAMVQEGRLDPRRLKIINRQNFPAFPYAVSTKLYPEWPVAVMPQVDEKTASRLAAALFLLPRNHSDGIAGFTTPANYAGVEILMRHLRIPPFDRTPEIRPADLWRRYAEWIVTLGGLMLLLAVASSGLVVMYRRSRQAEAEIRRLNRELERRVAERTTELQAANRELETFTYSVSHDLRQPLRAIDGYLALLKEHMGTALDAESRRYMTTISEAALRMAALIDDLLSFSRSGRFEMNKTPVDLGALAHEVVREFEPKTEGRTIEWRIGDLPVIHGDRAMLRVVLGNLISNAIKFTQPRERALIEVGSQADDKGEVVIYVRDNGVGFDMRYAEKLFGVFQRLHGVSEFKGAGIGLANVRRVIARHGGRTWAEGKVDGGATFYFSLPQSSAAHHSGNAEPEAEAKK